MAGAPAAAERRHVEGFGPFEEVGYDLRLETLVLPPEGLDFLVEPLLLLGHAGNLLHQSCVA